ncbi:MAG: DUF6427 family protein [Chitinophagaceae bacterium]
MLHLFRANSPYTVIILFILTLVLKLQALAHAIVPVPIPGAILYNGVLDFFKAIFGNHPAAYTLIAILFIFSQSLYLRGIALRHRLMVSPNYLPSLVFIILSSLHPAMGFFSAPLWLNWLLLGGIDIALGFTKSQDRSRAIFNAGFVLALAALWFSPALFFLVFLLLALVIMRPIKAHESVISLIGYGLPFYFALGLLYLFNILSSIKEWPQFGVNIPHHFHSWVYLPIVILGCLFLLASGVIRLSQNISRLPITVRRCWSVVGVALLAGISTSLFSTQGNESVWITAMPMLSLLVVPTMASEKRSRFATFTFYFLIIFVVYCQLALPS